MVKDENGNVDCGGLQHCSNCVKCNNSTRCNNSTGCSNSTQCDNSTGCDNSTQCNNSTWCDNSTWCNNSAFLLYCNGLVLEKYCVFNKQVTKKQFEEIKDKIRAGLPCYLHPRNLTKENIAWLKKNVKQFSQAVLNEVIANSVLPDKPVQVD